VGITIVQKSDLSVVKPFAPKGLVLSGGALTGATFKVGGIKALNDYFANFSVNNFDIFVGISSGSLVAVPLAAGLSPEEMLRSLDGNSKYFYQLAPWHFYWPNLKEFVTRPAQFCFESLTFLPKLVGDWFGNAQKFGPLFLHRLWQLVRDPTLAHYSALWSALTEALATRSGPSLLQLLPTGLFDNAPIERYLRENIERNHLTNNFQVVERLRNRKLYICAMTLDSAERVVFGPDERRDVTISEAVQASTALPIFYKPARIKGIDYVDGGVFSTAHIDVAVAKGAQLIVCYNPFRPIENNVFWEYLRKDDRYVTKGRPLSMDGLTTVLNQIFRAIFFIRLQQSLDHYRHDPSFTGDIILIQPRASDMAFFELNPLIFSNRTKAARMGFESVRNSIEARYDDIAPILASYGINMTRDRINADVAELASAGQDARAQQRVLEGRSASRGKSANKHAGKKARVGQK